jgi:hypothetical protein
MIGRNHLKSRAQPRGWTTIPAPRHDSFHERWLMMKVFASPFVSVMQEETCEKPVISIRNATDPSQTHLAACVVSIVRGHQFIAVSPVRNSSRDVTRAVATLQRNNSLTGAASN